MKLRIVGNKVMNGNYIFAQNVRKEGKEIIADGIYNIHIDENGDAYKMVETIVTIDGDCVTIK